MLVVLKHKSRRSRCVLVSVDKYDFQTRGLYPRNPSSYHSLILNSTRKWVSNHQKVSSCTVSQGQERHSWPRQSRTKLRQPSCAWSVQNLFRNTWEMVQSWFGSYSELQR